MLGLVAIQPFEEAVPKPPISRNFPLTEPDKVSQNHFF